MCAAYIKFGLAQKVSELLTAWLHTWEMIDPERQQCQQWRRIVGRAWRTREG